MPAPTAAVVGAVAVAADRAQSPPAPVTKKIYLRPPPRKLASKRRNPLRTPNTKPKPPVVFASHIRMCRKVSIRTKKRRRRKFTNRNRQRNPLPFRPRANRVATNAVMTAATTGVMCARRNHRRAFPSASASGLSPPIFVPPKLRPSAKPLPTPQKLPSRLSR